MFHSDATSLRRIELLAHIVANPGQNAAASEQILRLVRGVSVRVEARKAAVIYGAGSEL